MKDQTYKVTNNRKNKYEIDMCNGSLMDKLISFSLPLMLSGIARRRGVLIRNAQRRVILNSVRGTVWYAPPGGGR